MKNLGFFCLIARLFKNNLQYTYPSMKTFLVIVLLTSLFAFQEAKAQFGIRAGVSFSNFDGFDFESRTGMHAGFYYGIPVLDKIVIEPAFLYSQKGYKASATASQEAITENINYFDVPVLIRYKVLDGLNIFAGPQASVVATRKREEGGDVQTSTEIIRGYDLGALVGVGLNLPLGLNAQVSYDLGMTNLNYFNFDVKNRVFKFSVGKSF